MTWHLNTDRPLHTRHPEPQGWTRGTIASTWHVLALPPDVEMMCNAIHEAGHAAVMLDHGIPVISMVVYTEKEARDKPARATTIKGECNVDYMRIARALAAGERAVDKWLREERYWTPERAWAAERLACSDREELEQIARTYMRGELTYGRNPSSPLDYRYICDGADEVLLPLWRGVLALAGELVKRRSLTGAQVAAVISATTP
jgi:hypothetical protein